MLSSDQSLNKPVGQDSELVRFQANGSESRSASEWRDAIGRELADVECPTPGSITTATRHSTVPCSSGLQILVSCRRIYHLSFLTDVQR